MRLTIPLLAIAFTTGATATSAQYLEAGVSLGAANYAGDLSNGGYVYSEYNGAIGVFGRYNHSPRLAVKASVTISRLSGADARSQHAPQIARNLAFESPLSEAALLGEFNLLPYAPRANQGAALYVTAGVAGFRFSPYTDFNGERVDLRPLRTEGVSYGRTGLAIPFGGGVKVNLTPRVNVGVDVLVRRTFTDYLDDVSGVYADVEALHASDPLAAALSFRAPQYTGEPLENPVGTPRGSVDGDDMYLTALLSVGFNLTTKHGLDFDRKYAIFKEAPGRRAVQEDLPAGPVYSVEEPVRRAAPAPRPDAAVEPTARPPATEPAPEEVAPHEVPAAEPATDLTTGEDAPEDEAIAAVAARPLPPASIAPRAIAPLAVAPVDIGPLRLAAIEPGAAEVAPEEGVSGGEDPTEATPEAPDPIEAAPDGSAPTDELHDGE